MSAKNVGSTGLSINVATVPPGGIAYAYIHQGFEVKLFILQGKAKHTFGENPEKAVVNQAGDFIYIKPGVSHEVFRSWWSLWPVLPWTSGIKPSTTLPLPERSGADG
jgi:uncharacterized RmlC-like cupin family protein